MPIHRSRRMTYRPIMRLSNISGEKPAGLSIPSARRGVVCAAFLRRDSERTCVILDHRLIFGEFTLQGMFIGRGQSRNLKSD